MQLPVPIEMIVEQTYELEVVYDRIDEPADTMILGALVPSSRRIIMNTAHQDLLDTVIGPERFTLAHELAHWVYDAENPDQMSLEFADQSAVFCYSRESPALPETDRIREINANKLAAALLLPEGLLREAHLPTGEAELKDLARTWQVSYQSLTIRLDQLQLL